MTTGAEPMNRALVPCEIHDGVATVTLHNPSLNVVTVGGALAAARAIAARLARRAPQAMALCKQAIGLGFDYSLDDAMAKSFELSDRAFSSAECREGVRAFFAKETPRFGAPEFKGD